MTTSSATGGNQLTSRLSLAMSSAKRAMGRGLALLGAGALASSAALALVRWQAARAERSLPDEFVLELDLERLSLVEAVSSPLAHPLALLQGQGIAQVELRKVIRGLQMGGDDPKVKGLITLVGGRPSAGGMAMVQELRDAVLQFNAAAGSRGALSLAFAPAFGEAGSNATLPYYLASASNKVVMQPMGSLSLLGLQSQMLFLRGLLDKLQVTPVFFTREDYKTAAHMFTQRDYTPEHKENTQALLKGLVRHIWEGVATARGLTVPEVLAAVQQAPLLPAAALQSWRSGPDAPAVGGQPPQGGALLDGLQFKDQVLAGFQKSERALGLEREKARKAGGEAAAEEVDARLPRVPLMRYLAIKEVAEAGRTAQSGGWLLGGPWAGFTRNAQEEAAQGDPAVLKPSKPGKRSAEGAGWVPRLRGRGLPKVAVIHAVGGIVQGPVVGPRSSGQQVIDATKLSAQLARLAEAPDVKAVVLRISSPGGSALGSDTLHRALVNLKAAGKTLVVSCGDVAASGGMFMAVAGDRILAQPGTLTGSIGVVFGKFVVRELAEGLGAHPASVEEGGPNLTWMSAFDTPSPQQEAMINEQIDFVYNDFLAKVAAGRGMTVEAVRKLAGGRVYTGAQALQVGLVDELGGLQEAVAAAKKLAGLPDKEDEVCVFDFPPRRIPFLLSLLQAFRSPGLSPADDPSGLSAGAAADGQPGSGLSDWAVWGVLQGWGVLTALQAALPAALGQTGPSPDPAALQGGHGLQQVLLGPAQGPLQSMAGTAGAGGVGALLAAGVAHAPAVAAAARTLQTAVLLDGTMCAYSPEAEMLASSLQ